MEDETFEGKTLVFLSRVEEVPLALSYLQKNAAAGGVFVTHHPLVFDFFEEEKLSCLPLDGYASVAEREEFQGLALRLARQWFCSPGGEDLSLIDGVSIGFVFMRRFFYQILYWLNAVCHVSNLIAREAPDAVLYVKDNPLPAGFDYVGGEDLFKEVLKDLQDRRGYRLACIEDGRRPSSAGETRDPPRVLREKATGCLKEAVIACTDEFKSFLDRLAAKNKTNLFLPAASDITYLRRPLLEDILKSGPHVNLLYGKSEKNCYFHPRIMHCDPEEFRAPERVRRKVSSLKTGLTGIRNALLDNIERTTEFSYRGLSFSSRMASWAKDFFACFVPDFVEDLVSAEEMLRARDIHQIVLSNNSMSSSRMYSILARRRGIPAVYCPHGYTNACRSNGRIYNHPENDLGCFPFLYSHEVTGLNVNYEARVDNGIEPEKLIVAGMFQYRAAFAEREAERAKAREKLGLGPEEVVVYAPDIYWEDAERFGTNFNLSGLENLEIYKSLIGLFAQRRNSKLVVKFRPNDILIPAVEKAARRKNAGNVILMETRLQELLAAADAAIVVNTNVGFEALYHDIPVVQIKMPHRVSLLPLGEEGASILVESMRELGEALDRARDDKTFLAGRLEAQRNYLRVNRSSGEEESRRLAEILVALARQAKKPDGMPR